MKIKIKKLLLIGIIFSGLVSSNFTASCINNETKRIYNNNPELKELEEKTEELAEQLEDIINNIIDIKQNISAMRACNNIFLSNLEKIYTPPQDIIKIHKEMSKSLPPKDLCNPTKILTTKDALTKKFVFNYGTINKISEKINECKNKNHYGTFGGYSDFDLAEKLQEINEKFLSFGEKSNFMKSIVDGFNMFSENINNFLTTTQQELGIELQVIRQFLYNKIREVTHIKINSDVSTNVLLQKLKNKILECMKFFKSTKENPNMSEYLKIINRNNRIIQLILNKYFNNSFKIDLNAFKLFEKYYNQFLDLLREYNHLKINNESQEFVRIQKLIDEIAKVPDKPDFMSAAIKRIKNNLKQIEIFKENLKKNIAELNKIMQTKTKILKDGFFKEMEQFNPYIKKISQNPCTILIQDINSIMFNELKNMAEFFSVFFKSNHGNPLFKYNDQNTQLKKEICEKYEDFAKNPSEKTFPIEVIMSFIKKKLEILEPNYKKKQTINTREYKRKSKK